MRVFRYAPALAAAMLMSVLAGCTTAGEEPSAEMESPTLETSIDENSASTAEPTPEPSEEVVAINDPWASWDGSGTVFLTGDAITPESPSDFLDIRFVGTSARETFDRRVENWVNQDSWIFSASYQCGLSPVEVVVNPVFTESEAPYEAT